MKKIVLSLAFVGAIVFASCKKDQAVDQVENQMDSIVEDTKDTLNQIHY